MYLFDVNNLKDKCHSVKKISNIEYGAKSIPRYSGSKMAEKEVDRLVGSIVRGIGAQSSMVTDVNKDGDRGGHSLRTESNTEKHSAEQ